MQREDNQTEALEVVHRFITAINKRAPDEVAACFRADYRDDAPARRGEFVRGRDTVRNNFGRLSREIPNLKADLLDAVAGGDRVWLERGAARADDARRRTQMISTCPASQISFRYVMPADNRPGQRLL